jgi:hypothetical protein
MVARVVQSGEHHTAAAGDDKFLAGTEPVA